MKQKTNKTKLNLYELKFIEPKRNRLWVVLAKNNNEIYICASQIAREMKFSTKFDYQHKLIKSKLTSADLQKLRDKGYKRRTIYCLTKDDEVEIFEDVELDEMKM